MVGFNCFMNVSGCVDLGVGQLAQQFVVGLFGFDCVVVLGGCWCAVVGGFGQFVRVVVA